MSDIDDWLRDHESDLGEMVKKSEVASDDHNCQWRVRFLWSANRGILYYVHHIVGIYITLFVDTLAVASH